LVARGIANFSLQSIDAGNTVSIFVRDLGKTFHACIRLVVADFQNEFLVLYTVSYPFRYFFCHIKVVADQPFIADIRA